MDNIFCEHQRDYGRSINKLLIDIDSELERITEWWIRWAVNNGNIVGEIDNNGLPDPSADKSVILVSRLLWFMSEVAIYRNSKEVFDAATKVYEYFIRNFIDEIDGGVVWLVDKDDRVADGRKQIYAQSFAIYALVSYFKLTGLAQSIDRAMIIFECIEKYGVDKKNGGYFEAFSNNWGFLEDVRLSDKDINSPKTMNNHLHLIEAYTELALAVKDKRITGALSKLLRCYLCKFYIPENNHFRMFQTVDWIDQSIAFSFGHDVESSWLIWKAANVINDRDLLSRCEPMVLGVVDACVERGLRADGSMIDLADREMTIINSQRVWWVQAETLVAFCNAYQISDKNKYLDYMFDLWGFIKKEVIDYENGEWFWLSRPDQGEGYDIYKAGFWKGPYHNGRALLEVLNRMG